jgi:hypothetical protein
MPAERLRYSPCPDVESNKSSRYRDSMILGLYARFSLVNISPSVGRIGRGCRSRHSGKPRESSLFGPVR